MTERRLLTDDERTAILRGISEADAALLVRLKSGEVQEALKWAAKKEIWDERATALRSLLLGPPDD